MALKITGSFADLPPEKPKRARPNRRKTPSQQAQEVAPVSLEHQSPVSDLEEEFTASDALRRVEDMADDRKVRGWNQDDLDILAFILFAAVFIGTARLARNLAEPAYKPTSDELDRFCKPLARVVARRIKIPAGRSGDVVDGLACLAAVAAYGMRIWDHEERKRSQRTPHEPVTPAAARETPVTPVEMNGNGPKRAAMPNWAREALEEDR